MIGDGIADIVGVPKSIGPQMHVNCCRPASNSMKKYFPCLLLKVPYTLFSFAILKMGICSAVTDGLSVVLTMVNPFVLSKAAIIGMVMTYRHAVVTSIGFKCLLSIQCVGTGGG